VTPAAPRLANRGDASSASVVTREAPANRNSKTWSAVSLARVPIEKAPNVQRMTAATMQAVRARHAADGVMQGSGHALRIAWSVDSSMAPTRSQPCAASRTSAARSQAAESSLIVPSSFGERQR
jgi:hypothetical protein